MGYDRLYVIKAVLASIVFLVACTAAFAATVPAGHMALGQRGTSLSVCHWSAYSGGLFVTGSDAFVDVCHCGAHCARYALPPEQRGKRMGDRSLSTAHSQWVRGAGFARHASFQLFRPIARATIAMVPCGLICASGRSDEPQRAVNAVQPDFGTVRAVPLPAPFWLLIAGVMGLWAARSVARAPHAVVQRT